MPGWAVPVSAPVATLNVAQAGLPEIEKPSTLPSGSLAVGAKLYAAPLATLTGGVPEIVGAVFPGTAGAGVPGAVTPENTVIWKAGREAMIRPSDALTTILAVVPTSDSEGVPCS